MHIFIRLVTTAVHVEGNRGDWGPWDFCPLGHFAVGFRVWQEDDVWYDDETATNAVEVLCGGGGDGGRTWLRSLMGLWGVRGVHWPCPGGYTGARVYEGAVSGSMYQHT